VIVVHVLLLRDWHNMTSLVMWSHYISKVVMLIFWCVWHRDIERRKSRAEQDHEPRPSQVDNYQQLLMLCLFLMLLGCVICMRSSWRTASALRRVPTMSYYMIDEDSSPSSVHVQKCRSYSQLSRSMYSSEPS